MMPAYTPFKKFCLLFIINVLAVSVCSYAQTADTTRNGQSFTLSQCINYALQHQPELQRSLIGVDIARAINAVNLSSRLPQVNVSGNALHYIQRSGDVIATTSNVSNVSGSSGTTTGAGSTTTGGTTTGGTTTGGNTTGTGTGGTTTGTGTNTGTTTGTGNTGGTTTGTGTTTGGTTTGGTTTGNGTTTGTGGTTTNTSGTTSRTGSQFTNSFIPQLTVSQSIFTPNLLYASRIAPYYVKQAQQITDSTRIYIVSSVSKSFYNLLQTLEQINVLKEDTARLGKNVRDTYHQYKGGIVDETDYDQAVISLNNSKAQLKQASNNTVPLYSALKQSMGYPPRENFNVSFDTLQMIKGIGYDTTQQLQFEKRIEYQYLNTVKGLQHQLVDYYHYSYIPTVSAFFSYNYEFANSNINVFAHSYPSSLVGLSFNIPIFTGFARINNLRRAKLQEDVISQNQTLLRSQIYTEYTSALANYKSNLYNLRELQTNVNLAKRVYFIVNLQYRQGIIPYLNVITAESSLITSQINYINALFQLLSSKIDLQKAMGNITY